MDNTYKNMGDILQPPELTEEEKQQREYDKKYRELKISNARAEVVKKQIVDAYSILETIRFDYIGDSAFRDCIVGAKRDLETALRDFLLSTSYWEARMKEHRKFTPQEFAKRQSETSTGEQKPA